MGRNNSIMISEIIIMINISRYTQKTNIALSSSKNNNNTNNHCNTQMSLIKYIVTHSHNQSNIAGACTTNIFPVRSLTPPQGGLRKPAVTLGTKGECIQ